MSRQAASRPAASRPATHEQAGRQQTTHEQATHEQASRQQATRKGWPLYTIKRTRSRIYSKKGAAVARSESVWPYEDRPPIVDAILLADGFAQIERYLKPLVLSDEMSLLTRGISVEPPAASGRIIPDVRSNSMENSLPALSLLILFVGIDVSKAKLDVAVRAGQQLSQRVFANSAAGYQQLCDWLAGFAAKAVHICLEATGSYSPPVATFLEQAGYAVSVLNPAVLVDYRRSLNLRRKSDALDASLLARFAQERQPPLWHPLSQAVQVLRHWLRQRRQLLALHTQLTNFLEDPQLLAPIRQQWHEQREHIRQLQVISEVQLVRHLH